MLFVTAYNPNYVAMYPEKFEKGEKKGEWKLIGKEQAGRIYTEESFKSDKKKKQVKNEFLLKMSGLDRKSYRDQIKIN